MNGQQPIVMYIHIQRSWEILSDEQDEAPKICVPGQRLTFDEYDNTRL